ncbi:putative barnase/colicin E5 family endoribonuclease, partial [Campylobacter coli]|uniref:putative barnase/colicin E5 family endoribonuclease n=1 Tax=Campylobacter coli TaxID=195 RepID=UPI000707868F
VEQGLNKNNPQFIQDSAKRTSAILKNISNALQGMPTTQRREVLLKAAQAYPEIGSFLDDVLKADRDASISFLNMIKGQDEVFKNKTGLNGEFDYKAWQKDNSSYKKRINNEYAQAIKSIDELNNGSIRLSKEDLAKIEEFKNNNFLEQDIKTNISSFLEDAIDKDLSAEQIFNLRSAINKQLATGNKTYNTKEAYRLVKDTLDETMIKNASDKELAKKILEDANKNYALKENFNNSYLGKIKDQETPEALAQRIANGARNINEDKDLKRAFEGMNEAERKANEKHAFNALLAKHRIEDIGYDFKNLAKDMDNVEFVSKDLKYAKEVVNVYAKIYQNNKDLIMTALASSGKKTNSSIATTIQGVFDRILISGVFARIHALVPFMKSAKEQALRNQILDALKLAKTNKEVISNLKNIKIADQEQSRIFKDALDNYIKVDKEQNKILKDALIKEGVIKGDNFFMDKADPSKAKSDLNVKISVSPNVRNLAKLTNDEIIADLEYLANKHNEMFKKPSDVFKLIKEIKENPTFFYKNNRMDIALIAKRLNDNKLGKLGINKDTGEVRHVTKVKEKDLTRLEKVSKKNTKENVGIIQTFIQPGSKNDNSLNGLPNNPNSTQTKPKTNLMDDIKENIKAKEVKKKNKKSVKQKLDKKIQDDKKASEDILKRYDNFLKENKNNKLDFLDKMNLNTVEYNLTRQMIINAKESTNKGIKKDIPSALRGKIEQELNIQPLKEFGENYTEYYHDGKGALQKLLIEKQGQVAGAFHRKDLGDIDLVWGDGNFGLSHIINRREEDFIKQGLNKIEAKNKALNFIKEIENIINNGNVKKGNNRAFIDIKNSRVMVALDYKGKDKKWIITAYNFY